MITYIIILSLCIWGFAALFQEGMLLEKLGNFLVPEHITFKHGWLERNWHKPILSCPICMASFWGTVASAYLFTSGRFDSFEQWIILVFATCGLNFIITRILS